MPLVFNGSLCPRWAPCLDQWCLVLLLTRRVTSGSESAIEKAPVLSTTMNNLVILYWLLDYCFKVRRDYILLRPRVTTLISPSPHPFPRHHTHFPVTTPTSPSPHSFLRHPFSRHPFPRHHTHFQVSRLYIYRLVLYIPNTYSTDYSVWQLVPGGLPWQSCHVDLLLLPILPRSQVCSIACYVA